MEFDHVFDERKIMLGQPRGQQEKYFAIIVKFAGWIKQKQIGYGGWSEHEKYLHNNIPFVETQNRWNSMKMFASSSTGAGGIVCMNAKFCCKYLVPFSYRIEMFGIFHNFPRTLMPRSIFAFPQKWKSAFNQCQGHKMQIRNSPEKIWYVMPDFTWITIHTSPKWWSREKKFPKYSDGTTKFFGSNAKIWYLKQKKVTSPFWENCVWSYTIILLYNAPENDQKSTFC